jgi:hypothetical protein
MVNNFLKKIKSSFIKASKGEENYKNVIFYWGLSGYLISFFIIDKSIKKVDSLIFDYSISILTIIYFIWHFYALKKCAPKKVKLSKEEKQRLKKERRKNFAKNLIKKLLLKDSFGKNDPVVISLVIDVFSIAYFLSFVIL